MGNAPNPLTISDEEFRRMANIMPFTEIAKRCGVHHRKVTERAAKLGIRSKFRAVIGSPDLHRQILELHAQGLTSAEIARRIGRHPDFVGRRLRREFPELVKFRGVKKRGRAIEPVHFGYDKRAENALNGKRFEDADLVPTKKTRPGWRWSPTGGTVFGMGG